MDLSSMLHDRNLSVYRLAQLSGVPKTTIFDICSGKSSIEGCTARTVFRLAKALGCSMEDLMTIDTARYDRDTGLPKEESYLEKGLPPYLEKSLAAMKASWEQEDRGERDVHWDLYWCELNADINSAEVENSISHAQAGYLRKKYLRMDVPK